MNYDIRRLWIHKSNSQKQLWQQFLLSTGIRFEENIEYCVGVYEADQLIATGSLFQNIIKCVAVNPLYKGGEVISKLISHLLNEVISAGNTSCFVYTKPEALLSFTNLGFKEIAAVEGQLVFLEKAVNGFGYFIDNLKKCYKKANKIAAIVMNANPFTLGHQYLTQYAARENDILHVFVLSESMSAFPTQTRISLVKQGVRHLNNVYIHETGDYMVSAKTFPSYFLKEDAEVTKIQAQLDAVLFKNQIAPALGITKRYVGEEPFSFATNIYNEAMEQVFAGSIQLIVIPRKQQAGEVISATRVRTAMASGHIKEIENMVPNSTFEFINSEEGRAIGGKLKREGY